MKSKAASATKPPRAARKLRRTQEERRRETKALLINATIEHLSASGFKSFSMAGIAGAEGLTRGAIQHHYPSREDLIADVVAEISRRMQPELDLARLAELTLADRVSHFVDHYWQITGSRTFLAVIEIIVFSRHDPDLFREVSRALHDVSRDRDIEWIEMFRDTPISAKRLHELRTYMLSTLRGLALRSVLEFEEEEREVTIALLKQSLCHLMQAG